MTSRRGSRPSQTGVPSAGLLGRRRMLGWGAGVAASLVVPRRARAQTAHSVVDSAGRTVALPGEVRRVFAAGPPAAILLFAVAPDRLLGWTTALGADEKAFFPEKYTALPTLGRLTGRGNTANVEVVLAAKPDLILDYGTINPTYASLADRVQEQTGIPYALIDGSFAKMPEAFRLLGALVGDEAAGEGLAHYAEETLADIDRGIAQAAPGRRPRVYYARGPKGLNTGLGGSINVESIERVGAFNVAAGIGKGGLADVSMEQLLLWDPEVIITTDAGFYAAVKKDKLWEGVQALQAGRVYLSPTLPFGWVDFPPSVNRMIGLHWLARLLYSDIFTAPLKPRVADFYARFYHQAPSDAQLARLLADTP